VTALFAKVGAAVAGIINKALGIATHFWAYMAGRRHERLDAAEKVQKVEREMRKETTKFRTTEETKKRLKDGSF
jgi:hypothetical protein